VGDLVELLNKPEAMQKRLDELGGEDLQRLYEETLGILSKIQLQGIGIGNAFDHAKRGELGKASEVVSNLGLASSNPGFASLEAAIQKLGQHLKEIYKKATDYSVVLASIVARIPIAQSLESMSVDLSVTPGVSFVFKIQEPQPMLKPRP
jgi:hypothetical protein